MALTGKCLRGKRRVRAVPARWLRYSIAEVVPLITVAAAIMQSSIEVIACGSSKPRRTAPSPKKRLGRAGAFNIGKVKRGPDRPRFLRPNSASRVEMAMNREDSRHRQLQVPVPQDDLRRGPGGQTAIRRRQEDTL